MDKEKNPSTYNGWTNYETWAVNLWLGNAEPSCHYWLEQAQSHKRDAPSRLEVCEGGWTATEMARFRLAEQLKFEIADASPLKEPSLYSDLLNAALSEVDWAEIAESLLR